MSPGTQRSCCDKYCSLFYIRKKVWKGIKKVITFSIEWKGFSYSKVVYFACVALKLVGTMLLIAAGLFNPIAFPVSTSAIALFWTVFVLIFGLASFSSVPFALFYMFFTGWFLACSLSYTACLIMCVQGTYACNKTAALEPVIHQTIKLVLLGNGFVVFGLLACLAMSLMYHWMIFKVGTSFLLFFITRCHGKLAPLLWMFLVCKKRDTRLLFNRVTLYHRTKTSEIADAIIKDQTLKPGKEGVVGGGIYFAAKPPDTKRKARIDASDNPPMLKATVHLGKIKKGVLPTVKWPKSCYKKESELTFAELQSLGYDSIYVPFEEPEFVVFNPDQVKNIRKVDYPHSENSGVAGAGGDSNSKRVNSGFSDPMRNHLEPFHFF